MSFFTIVVDLNSKSKILKQKSILTNFFSKISAQKETNTFLKKEIDSEFLKKLSIIIRLVYLVMRSRLKFHFLNIMSP